ncbi:hypothetical protein [Avibacterium paragallinarum]|uniref:hypothetical protein n=1 Tax=Avibacterium paragallinarum TaxID=728 RepID=UPI00397D6D49
MSKNKKDYQNELKNISIACASAELVSRYGSAGAEYLKGLRGIDYETGQKFDRSLIDISNYKTNPEYVDNNIKQQAGFSAEINSVSKKNAEAIIAGKPNRFSRSEDIAGYGKNHNVVDIIELIDGKEISTSQMKFVSNPEGLLKKIACGEGGGKNDLSRYMKVDKLEVPSEQVDKMKKFCSQEIEKLQKQANKLREQGNIDQALKCENRAKNYQELSEKITDSGLTTDEAIALRLNPRWETAKNIASISHRAGIEGAKFGAAIGGSISIISNIVALHSGNKEFGEAVKDASFDTLKAAGVGYATSATGAAVKSLMQQAPNEIVRGLSKTALPAMIVTACISTGKSVKRFINNEISHIELTQEIGQTAVGIISGSAFTMLGQIAIPIPVVGGLIGGMIGCAIANTFYQGFCNALQDAKLSAERQKIIEMECETSIMLMKKFQYQLDQIFTQKQVQLDRESQELFSALKNPQISADDFCQKINRFAEILGKQLSISNQAELDKVMLSEQPLII